jgi:hypothetical protein
MMCVAVYAECSVVMPPNGYGSACEFIAVYMQSTSFFQIKSVCFNGHPSSSPEPVTKRFQTITRFAKLKK